MLEKKCSKCKEIRPLSEFYKSKRTKSGYRYQCKKCFADYTLSKTPPKKLLPKNTKKCRTCKNIKDFKYFSRNKNTITGYGYVCKECDKKQRKENYIPKIRKPRQSEESRAIKASVYRQENRDKIISRGRIYYSKNKEKLNEKKKDKRLSNPEYAKEVRQRHYIKNNEKIRAKSKINYQKNKSTILRRNSLYCQKRIKSDPEFKLTILLRGRINKALKNQYGEKACSSMDLLGCSIKEARKHIEKSFTEGMNWSNHGQYGWHIDHIIPCASFDLTNPEQQKKCFHYTNLQALWWKDNLIKGAKYKII